MNKSGIHSLLLVISFALTTCYGQFAVAQDGAWANIHSDVVDRLNSDIKANTPTANIGIYYPSNLDKKFTEKYSINDLIEEFAEAKDIFAVAGVQLNLLWIRTGDIKPAYFEIQANNIPATTPSGQYANMYRDGRRQASNLSREAQSAFESIIETHPDNDRTVYLVVLQDVFMSFYEQVDERTFEARVIATGGLSFPAYSYQEIPRALRGVITVNKKDSKGRSIVAHELGHKLLNVSHEYRNIDPQHEVNANGGLMLYGTGTEIASGKDGRWHRERLHLSPFLYRQKENGERVWNADYREGGHYYDPVYGDKVVEFEPLNEFGKK